MVASVSRSALAVGSRPRSRPRSRPEPLGRWPFTGADAEARSAEVWGAHLAYARTGDPALLAELVEHYRGYAAALARRLYRDGEQLDDLVQVAMEALVVALQRFDPDQARPFVAYAAPTIIGTIKRHFRDRGWALRVPRRVHEIVPAARRTAERLTAELGRPARAEEVADAIGVSVEALLGAEEAAHARSTSSLDVTVEPESPSSTLGDLLVADDRSLAAAENRIALSQALRHLSGRDRLILDLYYGQEQSQRVIGERFGVSQMQVSRWLASAVARLRGHLAA